MNTRILACSALLLFAACDSNPYDATQRPRVSVVTAAVPVISWTPQGAQLVRVYRGVVAGDGYGASLWWSIAATSKNSLQSGIAYGATSPAGGTTDVAAKALVPGEQFTVEVTRADPKGKGDGFTGTSNRYVGTVTFTALSGQ